MLYKYKFTNKTKRLIKCGRRRRRSVQGLFGEMYSDFPIDENSNTLVD